MNFVKINFDGELFGEFYEAGLVVVIRNSEKGGGVIAAFSEKIMKPPVAETVELLVAHRVVAFSLEIGFQISFFEDDFVSVINFLKDRAMSNSHGVYIIKDIVFYANSF